MVKNISGGSKAKGFARKNQSSGGSMKTEKLRLPTCDLEQYGCVTKMFGNGMCEIFLNDNTRLIGHIRNKFSGGKKRNNLITAYSLVMVGLREWENPVKNCDILCIVDDHDIEQLKELPQINIRSILQMKLSNDTQSKERSMNENIVFSHDSDIPEIKLKQNDEHFNIELVDVVDIDDI